jgi:hypothetical protein
MSSQDTDGAPEDAGEDNLGPDPEYFASKGGGGHYEDDDGGHARRRLDEMISQRFPTEANPGEKVSEGSKTQKPPASSNESFPRDEDEDEGVPGGK